MTFNAILMDDFRHWPSHVLIRAHPQIVDICEVNVSESTSVYSNEYDDVDGLRLNVSMPDPTVTNCSVLFHSTNHAQFLKSITFDCAPGNKNHRQGAGYCEDDANALVAHGTPYGNQMINNL